MSRVGLSLESHSAHGRVIARTVKWTVLSYNRMAGGGGGDRGAQGWSRSGRRGVQKCGLPPWRSAERWVGMQSEA